MRPPLRNDGYFIEEFTIGSRHRSVKHHPREIIGFVLKEIEIGLEASIRAFALQPGARGGRRPLEFRHWMIVNLAEIAKSHGIKVSTDPDSPFAALCQSVASYFNWPTKGIVHAIPDAVRDWRNLP
jgi:hypothetical protein